MRLPKMGSSHKYFLVAGIIESHQQDTHAPLVGIEFTDEKRDTYNSIISDVEEINKFYYQEHGYVEDPVTFGEDEKSKMLKKIKALGRDIWDILKGDEHNLLRQRLEKMLRGTGNARTNHVTILTNDFSIPWYWLR